MRRRVVLATRSPGKLRELQPLLHATGWEALSLGDIGLAEDPAEAGIEVFDTFEANALAKAQWFLHRVGGLPVMADDSGVEVRALGGAPGVHSRRWSGRADLEGVALDEANNALLLARMAGQVDRAARYVCAAAWAANDAMPVVVRGETSGVILGSPRGSGGFGYDPYFWSEELGMTFGEATREAKEGVSHRGRAFRLLVARLEAGR